jgi:hypothetical protein
MSSYRVRFPEPVMMLRVVALLACLFSLTSCATGLYQPVWTATDASQVTLGRTVVAVLVPSEADRRQSEGAFVQYLQPAMDMTALHQVAAKGGTAPASVDAARAEARRLGFDSLLVARVVETYQRDVFRPSFGFYYGGHPYYGIWGRHPFDYWDYPGHVDSVRRSVIEVSLYATADNALVWSGKAELFTPESFAGVVEPLADALLKDLVSRGMVR